MTAEILCVGTEILLGDIVNTNAQFLARELAKLGISVHYQTVVGDNAQRLKSVLQIAFSRADMVVLTGGLGPTKDDLTKEIVAQYFGLELVFDQKAYDMLEKRILSYGLEKISESNRKQAYVPKGAIVLYNDNGTAPGCIIEKGGKTAILLPGPPNEMEAMFARAREAYLNSISENTIFSVNIKIKSRKEISAQDSGESAVADKISHLLDLANPTVATYAKEDGVLIRVTACAENKEKALEAINPVLEQIKSILGNSIAHISEAE